MLKKV
jgi:hypothetical protein